MKGKVILEYRDSEALEKASLMNMPEPEPQEVESDFYFKLEHVSAAFINDRGDMVIFLPSGSWLLKYNEKLWLRIKTYLEDK